MKKLLPLFVATAVLLPASPVMLSVPAAAAQNENVAVCRDLIATPTFSQLSLGECVSILTVEDNYFAKGTGASHAAAVLECNLLPQYDPVFYATFGSKAECVEFFETLF